MRDMMITLIFETILRFERGDKAGLRLWRRILQAFPLPRSAPAGGFLRLNFKFTHMVPCGIIFCLPLLFCACSDIPGKLLIMEANFHHSRGMYNEAISTYQKAYEHEEAAPYSEFGLGSAYFALGEEKAALKQFAEAEKLLESHHSNDHKELHYRIHYNTGVVLFSKGDFSGAADSFRKALKVDGGKKDAKQNLELSLQSLLRENKAGGDNDKGENESMDILFQYVRQKESNQWESRQWEQEEDANGLDY
jgi:Ca-activated chloride channel family protein